MARNPRTEQPADVDELAVDEADAATVEPPVPAEEPLVEDDDSMIRTLLAERAELAERGLGDRVSQVDEQIELRRARLATSEAGFDGRSGDHLAAAEKRAAALEGRDNAADMIRALLVERQGYVTRGREGDDARIAGVDAELARLGYKG